MPKLIAPHGASFRGRVLETGEMVEATDAEAFDLFAHGFRLIEEKQDSTGTLSTTALPETADRMSAIPVEPSMPEMPEVDSLPRKDLLKLLGGRGLGKIFVKPTEELRRLAAEVLAHNADDE